MMKDTFLKIIMFLAAISVIFTCTEDENLGEEGPIATCFDGIMNGAEEGVDCGGTCVIVCPQGNQLEGEIVVTLELDPSVEYLVTGPLLIRDGAKLLIPAGTVIKVQPDVNAYIAFAQGGQIFANGQPDNPIIFTSNADVPTPGDWGGIIFAGKAPINTSTVDRTEILDIFYGGTETDDTSGVMKYLRVEYAGAEFDETKQFNAFSFYGVGAFTTCNYVQAVHCLGDGFKFIGGSINPKWMVATGIVGNGFHITDGWNGQGDSWYISDVNKAGIKIGNNPVNEGLSPITTGSLKNVSIIGPLAEGAIQYTNGGAMTTFENIYTSGIDLGINVVGDGAISQIDMGNLIINSIQFADPGVGFNATNYSGTNSAFYTIGTTIGAGNEAELPTWASSWTTGFN